VFLHSTHHPHLVSVSFSVLLSTEPTLNAQHTAVAREWAHPHTYIDHIPIRILKTCVKSVCRSHRLIVGVCRLSASLSFPPLSSPLFLHFHPVHCFCFPPSSSSSCAVAPSVHIIHSYALNKPSSYSSSSSSCFISEVSRVLD